jgi:hypothetical protein
MVLIAPAGNEGLKFVGGGGERSETSRRWQNVWPAPSALSAEPLVKMEIRAFRAS